MGCCCGLVGLAAPRLALIGLWIFTNWISTAIDSWILSTIGFLFLPFTTLGYVLVYEWNDGVHGFGWVLVAGAFLLDIANYAGSGYTNKDRMPGASMTGD